MANAATVTATLCRCSKITRIVDIKCVVVRAESECAAVRREGTAGQWQSCVACFVYDTERSNVQDDECTVLALPAPALIDTA
jgi:hypothetical protein